jgi:hypothetical protein
VKSSLPPRSSNSFIQVGIFTRWSTDCAGTSRREDHEMAFPPAPSGTVNPMPSTGGHCSSHRFRPSVRSRASEPPNMHWLDMTLPARISSGVRLDTMVTS